jgi:uncharacterized Fe-S center protein
MNKMTRRDVLKTGGILAGTAALGGYSLLDDVYAAPQKPRVYFTKDLSAEGLKKLYPLINKELTGRIAVKLHTGEPKGPNLIPTEWVKALMPSIPNSSLVETNVYYSGPRATTEGHRELLRTNGWTFCPVDILDADGTVDLPVPGGKWFKEISMGKNLVNYDSMLVLTHFKGHPSGGFGGSLKNIAIGCASVAGKKQLHTPPGGKQYGYNGARFMEHLGESGRAVTSFFGPRIAYINVLRNMSVDCDCMGVKAAAPTAPDIGILASTDILAVEQASVDLVYALPEKQRHDLVERIESRTGLRQLEYMKILGMGNNEYELIAVAPAMMR